MRPAALFAASFAFALALAPAIALADGGGGGGSAGGTNSGCQRGEVWDQRSGRCVKQGSSLPDKVIAQYAYALAKAERYDEALATLDLLRDPNTPEALNYRGYATRKLGRLDEGIGYYLKSVALAPRYAQVREYLGEAYVTKGDMTAAEAQLRTIKGICGTNCEQYKHLAEAIANPAKL
jgi:tetratricopeptide (TPR) repeat protein